MTATHALSDLVRDAIRAPSSHNTQPWRFRVADDRIDLYADRTRALPVNDPLDRELVISCGAALTNLLVSASHFGWSAAVQVWPSDDPDLLATATFVADGGGHGDPLWAAIERRHTVRKAFTQRAVPDELVAALNAVAQQRGVWLHLVPQVQREAFAELVAKGDQMQFSDPSWRRELAAWMHPGHTGDGLRVPPAVGRITRLVVSHVDVGKRTGHDDAMLITHAPLLLVLGTDNDDEVAWLDAGQALERILLTAAASGVQAGFANQPCQVTALRPVLGTLIDRDNPQVVVRLGYPSHRPTHSARRDLAHVLIKES
jgi:nitroreductase